MPTTQVGRSWQANTNSKNTNHKQPHPQAEKAHKGRPTSSLGAGPPLTQQRGPVFKFGFGGGTPQNQGTNPTFKFGFGAETSWNRQRGPDLRPETGAIVKKSYSRAINPDINSSQISGPSSKDVPYINKFKLPKESENISLPLKNKYWHLDSSDEDSENNYQETPRTSPIRKNKRAQDTLSPKQIPQLKKSKVQAKKLTVTKQIHESQTPDWKKRDIGTQTDPVFKEKIIIPTVDKKNNQ